MYTIILDENLNEIDKFVFDKASDVSKLKKIKDVPDIEEGTKEVLNNLEYSVAVYYPDEKSGKIYLSFLNNLVLDNCSFDLDDVRGALVSEVFFDDSYGNKLLEKVWEVYRTGEPQNLIGEAYDNGVVFNKFVTKITKIQGLVYVLGADTVDYSALSIEQGLLFDNDVTAIVIIQDGCVVKCNDKYLELYGYDNVDDVIGQKLGFSGLIPEESLNLLYDGLDEIISGKLRSYSLPLEIKKDDELFRYFSITGDYIIFDGKPAVMAIHNDITEQEVNRRERDKKSEEALFFQENLELIQSASDTGISYHFNDTITRSSKLYEIIEREPLEDDLHRDITWDFIVDEDIPILNENYDKLRRVESTDFIIRINTAKGNLKYLHCYLKVKPDSDKFNENIAFYRDVTDEQLYLKELKTALKESLRLKDNLEHIQKISKTAMSYTNADGSLNWTSSVFNILKLDSDEYKDYHGTLFEFVLEEDMHYWYEAYQKCSPSSPESNTILRIKDGVGDIHYIRNYILCDFDDQGNEKSIINYYQDVTEEIERENKLKEALDSSLMLEKNLEKVQGISKTVLCYKNDKENGDIIWFSEGFNILETDTGNYIGTMEDHIISEDRDIWIEKHAECTPDNPEVSFMQRCISGSGELRYLHTFVAYEFDEDGNKISHVSLFQDVTENIERENKLKEVLNETLELQDRLNRIQSLSKTAIGYSNGLKYSRWTPEVFDILEIDSKDYKNNMDNIIRKFVIDEDLVVREEAISKITPKNPDATFNQRVKTGKGNIKYLRTFMHQEYDKDNNLLDRISFNQDITREVKYQNQLESALKDKEVLLTEVHHRVKNNLQIILSLIHLNKNFESDSDTILNDTENRIYAMALIHEKIYVSESLSNVDMKEYIESLVDSLFDMYWSDIKFHSNMKSIELKMEEAIPIGLIINELVTNTIKYAFPDCEDGNLYIEFKKENTKYTIIVKDDGVGLPKDFDLDKITSMGLLVVQNLILQLDGTLTILNCEGTGFKIEFETE